MSSSNLPTATRIALRFEALEDRVTPVAVRFDYSLDTSGYFNSADRRAALDRVAAAVTSRMTDTLSAITPTAGNTWSATVYNAVLGQNQTVATNLAVGQNEVVVYVTAGGLSAGTLAMASGGAYSASGNQAWLDAIRTRGQTGVDSATDFAAWGGMIAVNTGVNWNFSAGSPAATQYDFETAVTHEMMHLFGFGLSNPSFTRLVSGGYYNGSAAVSVYGGSVPMQAGSNPDHFAQGVKYGGQDAIMDPAVAPGVKKHMTELEYASLKDLGWGSGPQSPVSPPASPPPTITPSPLVSSNTTGGLNRIAVGNGAGSGDGVNAYGLGGQTVFSGVGFAAGFMGGERVATGEVNGDGIADYAIGAGPGGGPVVSVVDGRTGQTLYSFMAFESYFRGGVYVALGDINGDGKEDIAVGAGEGGGPRVKVYDGATGAQVADFWGIADPNFRGGVRVALGDLNGDGIADLVASAGEGGAPRVAGYDGRTVRGWNSPTRLFNDFYAFEPSLTNGAYVAVADLNGDGYGDLVAGAGEGGAPRVTVFSGRSLLRGVYSDWVANFYAGSPTRTGGVRVAATDLNGDGRTDLVTGPGVNTDGVVRVYSGGGSGIGSQPAQTFTRPEWATNGAYVG